VVPFFLVAGKGIAAAAKWVQGPQGKKYLAKLKDTAAKERSRYLHFKSEYDKAKTDKAKARWKRRMDRSRKRYEKMRLKDKLAKRGIVGDGPVLEYERNLLAMEWEDADAARKKQIEQQVVKMDGDLKKLHREATLLQRYGEDGGVFVPPSLDEFDLDVELDSQTQTTERNVDRELENGLGGMAFTVTSPPGPARLARLPFYPLDGAQSWSGISGIEFPGDDPVASVTFPAGSGRARPIVMSIKLDYAKYRLLGLQANMQSTYAVTVPPIPNGTSDIAITLKNFQLYNGQQLFVVDSEFEMSAMTFDILPSDVARNSGLTSGPTYVELPFNYRRRMSRFFTGMRDQPLVDSNATIYIMVEAFWARPQASDVSVPFTLNAVIDFLEDKVYGDPKNPSPASRAGANVKLGTRELGISWEGRDQLELQNPVYVPPSQRGYKK
jgi:hypothetical protein